jgi:hypothetical protein
MLVRLFTLLLLVNISACQREDAAFDVGPGAYGQVACIQLQDQYRACYGPGWSEGVERKKANYDFYSISIEQINPDGRSSVLFEKKFAANEVNPRVLTPETPDIVQFDGMTIRFLIHEPPYEVDLSQYISRSNEA